MMEVSNRYPSKPENAELRGRYLFYRDSGAEAYERSLAPPYVTSVWRPSNQQPWPPGISDLKIKVGFLFRWVLHYLRLLANRECGAICIFFADRLVHYSAFSPRYWRFPFLADDDLQIGNTWTEPTHRGKGLAFFALEKILVLKRKPGRYFWYVVEAINRPSIRVVERAGFELADEGSWQKPFGIKLFGSYVPGASPTTFLDAPTHHRPRLPGSDR
jgi:RimJ/RimL family protein N-acetyltransferase